MLLVMLLTGLSFFIKLSSAMVKTTGKKKSKSEIRRAQKCQATASAQTARSVANLKLVETVLPSCAHTN